MLIVVRGVVVSGTVGVGLYRVSPVSRAGLLDGAVSTVGPTVPLKSGNASEPVVLTVLLLKVVKTVVPVPTLVVVESKPALGKSLVSLVLKKYVVGLVLVMVVLILRTVSVSNTVVISLLVVVSTIVTLHVSVVEEVLAISVTVRGLCVLVEAASEVIVYIKIAIVLSVLVLRSVLAVVVVPRVAAVLVVAILSVGVVPSLTVIVVSVFIILSVVRLSVVVFSAVVVVGLSVVAVVEVVVVVVVVMSVTPSDEAEGLSDSELESPAAVREEELRLFSEAQLSVLYRY